MDTKYEGYFAVTFDLCPQFVTIENPRGGLINDKYKYTSYSYRYNIMYNVHLCQYVYMLRHEYVFYITVPGVTSGISGYPC